MMLRSLLPFFFLGCLLLSSCDEDDSALPAYRQDLVELATDAAGNVQTLILDNGLRYDVDNQVGGLQADTLYRALAMYVVNGDQVTLHAARRIISPMPVVPIELEVVADPLDLKATWSSPRYLNLLVGLPTGGGAQELGFVEQGIEQLSGGIRKLKLQLYHNQLDDPAYYTQEVYLSCPLYGYEHELKHGVDSVQMEVMTHQGKVRKSYLY